MKALKHWWWLNGDLVLMVAFVSGLIAVVLVGVNAYARYQCHNYERFTGRPVLYANFDACYIKTDAGWQRYDEYKMRALASEGLRQEVQP